LATELKPEGITVVALSPGWVKTDMGGSEADLKPESVGTSIEQTVQSLTLRQTGRFLDRLGNTGTYSW
jgi:NAD(P)-dependent dehydrogenase (short-subunit alcohol dehydrogenase family)